MVPTVGTPEWWKLIARRILRALTETIRAVACCADLAIDLRATARIGGAIGLFDLQRAGADELGPDGDTD